VLWHIDDSWAINFAVEGDAEQHWYFLHYKDGAAVEKTAINKGVDVVGMFPSLSWMEENNYEVIKLVQKVGDAVIVSDQYFHWCEVVEVSCQLLLI
jgi:JmjC domain, hydroxylase